MPSLNKCMFIGRLGREPELRYTASGTAQSSFSLAVDRNFKKPDGTWANEAEWLNIVVWADTAERISTQLSKGSLAYVEGRLQTRSWDDDQGVKHYRTEVIADKVFTLDPKDKSASAPVSNDKSDLPFD